MIAFVDTDSGQIYLVDLNDRIVRQLTNDETRKGSPSWSPDGRRILYSAGGKSNSDLYVIEVGGGTPEKVVSGPADDVSPAWNPVAASSK